MPIIRAITRTTRKQQRYNGYRGVSSAFLRPLLLDWGQARSDQHLFIVYIMSTEWSTHAHPDKNAFRGPDVDSDDEHMGCALGNIGGRW